MRPSSLRVSRAGRAPPAGQAECGERANYAANRRRLPVRCVLRRALASGVACTRRSCTSIAVVASSTGGGHGQGGRSQGDEDRSSGGRWQAGRHDPIGRGTVQCMGTIHQRSASASMAVMEAQRGDDLTVWSHLTWIPAARAIYLGTATGQSALRLSANTSRLNTSRLYS